MGKQQIEELKKHGSYFSVPHGISMKPMIYDLKGVVEIHLLEGEAKRYDVVMYENQKGAGVIHRVLRVKDDHYVINGDNNWFLEYVPKSAVCGIAVRFYRKGKWYDCDCRGYRIYSRIWANTYFIRMPVFWVRDKIKKLFRRVRNKLKS